jgi:hypothetical protein
MSSSTPTPNGDRNLYLNMPSDDVRHIIETQLSYANYLRAPEQLKRAPDRVFRDNQSVWHAVINERIRASMFITLEDFAILEWFPRSPGLFFTPGAELTRQKALLFLDDGLQRLGSEIRYALAATDDRVTVFNPHGKLEMLRGGIGAIRLKPRQVSSSEDWFMCASSNGIAHEGFPLVMPAELYEDCVDEIADRHICRRTVIGKLQFMPEPLVRLYEDYAGVPQLYLKVEELRPIRNANANKIEELAVTVGVSFRSSYEGQAKTYATFVYFDPTRPESFERNVGWMEETYVEGRYKGRIITDFDEVRGRFANAPFSLSKVMEQGLNREEVYQTVWEIGTAGNLDRLFEGVQKLQVERMEVHVGDRIDIKGQAVGVGRGAQANNVSLNQVWNERAAGIDIGALASELAQLRKALKEEPDSVERDKAIGLVADAEEAAKEGDAPTTLERLAKAGKWVLGVAERIGTTVAAAAIKTALGV